MTDNLRDNAFVGRPGAAFAFLALTFACVLLAVGLGASAQPAYALDHDSTLTIAVQYEEEDGSTTLIDGAELTAYQVATLEPAGYELVAPFDGVEADFNAQMTTNKMLAIASKMADVAADAGVAGATAVSGADGKAAFGILDPGVYLVVQTDAHGTALDFYDLDPFLINVPQFNVEGAGEDGVSEGTVFDVVALPKPEPVPVHEITTSTASVPGNPTESTASKPHSSTTHSPSSKSVTHTPPRRSPQTGDSAKLEILVLCGLVGAISMCVAIAAARRRRD